MQRGTLRPAASAAIVRAVYVTLLAAASMTVPGRRLNAQTNPCVGRDVGAIWQAEMSRPGSQRDDPCASWMVERRSEIRREIVAQRHGGVDPCPEQAIPEATLATFVEASEACKELGTGMINRVQELLAAAASGAPGEGPRSGGAGATERPGGGDPTEGPRPLSEEDAEKALREAMGGAAMDSLGPWIRGRATPASIQEANDVATELYDDLNGRLGRSGDHGYDFLQGEFVLPPRERDIVAGLSRFVLLAGVQDAEGKLLFPSLKAALPVARVLAQKGLEDPDYAITLERLRALLIRHDVEAHGSRGRGPS